MKTYLKILSLVILPHLMWAQSLQSHWEKSYPIGSGEFVHSSFQSNNGWIILVGEVETSNQKKNGLFLVIDPIDGNILYNKQFGGSRDDVLLDVTQAADGTLYLAGYSESKGKKDKDGWLIHVDEEGQKLEEEAYFDYGDDEAFSQVVALPSGAVLLAGKSNDKSDGYIWTMRVEQMQMRNQLNIGDGNYRNLVGALLADDGNIWLCGNVEGRQAKRKGAVWATKVDEKGNPVIGSEKFFKTEGFGEITHMKRSIFNNNIILTGSTIHLRKRDAWIIELDQSGYEYFNHSLNDKVEEFGMVALKTIRKRYLLLRQLVANRQNQMVFIDRTVGDASFEIKNQQSLYVTNIIYTFDYNFLVVGNVREGRKSRIKLISYAPDYPYAIAKSEPTIQCNQPILVDGDRDGFLRPGERGYIRVELVNTSTSPILDGRIIVDGISAASNFNPVYFSYLAPGGRKVINIPINGSELQSGQLNLTLKVRNKNQLLQSVPFQVVSTGQAGKFQIFTDIKINNNSTFNRNRPVRVASQKARINYEASASHQLKATDFRVKKNGVWLEDNKDIIPNLDIQDIYNNEGFEHKHILSFDLPLDTGDNQVIIEVLRDGVVEKRDTIYLEYSPLKPNLHVLSIGPESVNLKYNSKDAKDFASLMKAQEDKGYFDEVFIDVLTDSVNTQTRNLSIALKELPERFRDKSRADNINQNDVLVIFISSHGILTQNNGEKQLRIMASDFDSKIPEYTTVDYETSILQPLRSIDCKKIIFIDACHSGVGAKNSSLGLNRVILELNRTLPGLLLITSSMEDENSYENEAWQNGAFTKAIKEAFTGTVSDENLQEVLNAKIEQVDGQQFISMGDLYDFISTRVPNLVKQIDGTLRQQPYLEAVENNEELKAIKFLITPPQNPKD